VIDVEALLDEAKRGSVVVKCIVCKWLATRPEAEREKWQEMIYMKRGTFSQIEKAMDMVPKGDIPSPRAHSLIHHRTGKHGEV